MNESTTTLEHLTAVLHDKKACEVSVIDVRDKTSLADFFVICHATSDAHSSTLADAVQRAGRDAGFKLISADTAGPADWKVLDFGDVIVHLFLETSRRFYDLESIWTADDPVEALERRQDLRRERKQVDARAVFTRAARGRDDDAAARRRNLR